jgi:hypothetical protein
LALAWQAAGILSKPVGGAQERLFEFDCIAIDEAQDLTPIEAFVLVELATAISRRKKRNINVLAAGDEAQTVRPTDFEWGWFQDLLHFRLGSPTEFKLGANLRSPRRIAELVNRVWDLYLHLSKQDRPGGTGLAEIDEDASDQILYCSATPGEELSQLLRTLGERAGLAILCLEEKIPDYVPAEVQHKVLTVAEAKGLDFHSVCVLDGGKSLALVTQMAARPSRGSDVEAISKRLAIDQLRVALSRPTERLYWLDVSAPERVIRGSQTFLNGHLEEARIAPAPPAVIEKTLEEETLDIEERVRLCETDARQFLEIKPAMAWSRAKQAVALASADELARQSAHLTLAQVSFCLAFRKVTLPAELGRPNLYGEAVYSSDRSGKRFLGDIFDAVAELERVSLQEDPKPLLQMAGLLSAHRNELPSWLLVELSSRSELWVKRLESAVDRPEMAGLVAGVLPEIYDIFQVLDAPERAGKMRQRAIRTLLTASEFQRVLDLAAKLPERQLKLEAECYEGLGEFKRAAECFIEAGQPAEALRNLRAIPDFEASLRLVSELPDHPATQSLQWIGAMQKLVSMRPENFTRVVTAAEKKTLEELLETALGVQRKQKAAAKKAAAKKVPAKKAAKKAPVKRSAAVTVKRRRADKLW